MNGQRSRINLKPLTIYLSIFCFLFIFSSAKSVFAQSNQAATFTSQGYGPLPYSVHTDGCPYGPVTQYYDQPDISVVGRVKNFQTGLQYGVCGITNTWYLVPAGSYAFNGNFSVPSDAATATVSITIDHHSTNPDSQINGTSVGSSSTMSFTYDFTSGSQGQVIGSTGMNNTGSVFLSRGANSLSLQENNFDGNSAFVVDWTIVVTWYGNPLASPTPTPSATPTPTPKPPCGHDKHGDPVDTFTGMPVLQIDDFNYNRPAFPLKFTRYYTKNLESPTLELGRDWMSNYDKAIISPTFDFSQATVIQPDSIMTYNLTSGNYVPVSNSCDQLISVPVTATTGSSFLDGQISASPVVINQVFQLTDKYGIKHYFGVFGPGNFTLFGWWGTDQFIARYLGSVDLNGNAIAMTYSQANFGLYMGWTGGAGGIVPMGAIAMSDNVRPAGVTVSNGTWSIGFTYAGGRLTHVTNSVGDDIGFGYSGNHYLLASSGSVTTGVDPSAPISLVTRQRNGSTSSTATYAYSTDSYGNYQMTQKDDVLETAGQKHIQYIRGVGQMEPGWLTWSMEGVSPSTNIPMR